MCNKYFKSIDYEKYLELNSIISRRIFLILTKWRRDYDEIYLKYENLYNRIPLVEGENRSKNRNIKNAANSLMDGGFITSFEADRNGIKFFFPPKQDKSPKPALIPKSRPYEKFTDILQGLESFGLTASEIYEVLDLRERKDIAALLRYADERRMAGTLNDNPKNFVLKGVQQSYNLDPSYY